MLTMCLVELYNSQSNCWRAVYSLPPFQLQ